MSCGAPAGSEGVAPPMGQGGAQAQEMEAYSAAIAGPLRLTSLAGSVHTIRFSATDNDTVEWTSGTLVEQNGLAYAISSGNTGNMTSLTFIYLDTNIDITALQVTDTGSESVGPGKFLVCVAEDVADVAKDAQFQVMGSPDSKGLFTAANIAANTITGNEIVANAITAGHIDVASLSAISADLGTITAGTIQADVIVAAESFTAAIATFNGLTVTTESWFEDLTHFEGGTQMDGGAILEFYDSGAVFRGDIRAWAAGAHILARGDWFFEDNVEIDLSFRVNGDWGFGVAPTAVGTVTGVRTGTLAELQTVMANLLSILETKGLLVDSTT